MDKPKILIFSLAYDPLWGGAEIAVKNITDRLTDISFDMVTLKFDKNSLSEERVGNINVYRINSSKLLFPFKAYYKAKKLHKEKEYNIVWSLMANRAGFATLFFKLKFPEIKFLLTLQEGDPFEYIKQRAGIIWIFVKPFFKKIFTKADHIQAISTYLANWARNIRTKCPIEVIPNGVDMGLYNLCDRTNFIVKKNNKTVLITTSRLVKKNGIEDLIEATKILNDKGYKVRTLILGAGDQKKYKQHDNVKFLGDISQKEIPKYLKSADIFVRPSLSEGLGISFLEAMAIGLPIIGTPVGGIPDFLTDQVTGLFCEVNNPQSIAEKVELLLKDDNLREQLVSNAQNLISEKYDWDVIARKMQVIFFKLNG